MRRIVILFFCLFFLGCGNKSRPSQVPPVSESPGEIPVGGAVVVLPVGLPGFDLSGGVFEEGVVPDIAIPGDSCKSEVPKCKEIISDVPQKPNVDPLNQCPCADKNDGLSDVGSGGGGTTAPHVALPGGSTKRDVDPKVQRERDRSNAPNTVSRRPPTNELRSNCVRRECVPVCCWPRCPRTQ